MRHQLPCDACARSKKVMVSMYRCPRCMRTSCSLACVKAHKAFYSCDGTRDRAAPVPKRDYTEAHFISDYSLLEDARRAVDAIDAARPRNYRDHRAPKKTVYPDAIPRRRMELLAREGAKRGIDLRFMPSMFLRHRRNNSNVRSVILKEDGTGDERPFEKFMIWSMEVVFWGRDGASRVVKISDVDEDTPLKDILQGAVETLTIKKDRLSGKEDPYIDFSDVPPENISAFLKNEVNLIRRLADAPIKLPESYLQKAKKRKMADGVHVETYDMEFDTKKYNQIETGSNIRESLHGRTIVEYPIVHVVVKGSKEEKLMIEQLRDIFESPEPEASDGSDSDEERYYEPEDGEVEENDGDDMPMPDASREEDKIASNTRASKQQKGDSAKVDVDEGSAEKRADAEKDQKKSSTDETAIDLPKRAGEKLVENSSDTNPSTIPETAALGSIKEERPSDSATPNEGITDEPETAADVSSPSLSDIEVLPPGHYDKRTHTDIMPSAEISSRPSRGGKQPIMRSYYSDSEDDDDGSVHSNVSDADSIKEELPAPAEKNPVEPGKLKRTGKRKSRFSDLPPTNQEVVVQDTSEDWPTSKRQKLVTVDSDVDDAELRRESADEEPQKSDEKEAPEKLGKQVERSPPLPFAFEYDSALLSDRIPRRKKLTSSGSLQTLTSC